VSSEVIVEAAREVVAAWVADQAAADPAFRGAFHTGSITTLPGAAPLPRTSDVDVTVAVAASALDRRKGKRLVDGLLVALATRAPDLAREREPGFRALVADLVGLRGPAELLTRRDALLAALP
jgi:hypothetical protein